MGTTTSTPDIGAGFCLDALDSTHGHHVLSLSRNFFVVWFGFVTPSLLFREFPYRSKIVACAFSLEG